MHAAPLPHDERDRLMSLRSSGILDTLPELSFDAITRTAARVLDFPVAAISFIDEDRQWYKSVAGLTSLGSETSRDVAFCAHTILDADEPLLVEDASLDPRFRREPGQVGADVVSYGGMAIVDRDRHALGALCVMDSRPRSFTERDVAALRDLAIWAGSVLDLRRTSRQLEVSRALQRATSLLNPQFEWVCDSEGRLLRTSPSLNHLTGLDHPSLLGTGWQRLIHPDDRAEMRELWATAVRSRSAFCAEHRLQTPQGDWLWFQTVAVPQRDADGLRWYGACKDISARRWQQRERPVEAAAIEGEEHDRLTDLPVIDVLRRLVGENCIKGNSFALLDLDIDNFQAVNDTLSWRDTDVALVTIAARLSACVGDRGSLARAHGHEFHIVQRTADAHDVALLAERIAASLRDPIVVGGHAFILGVSIGAVLSPSGGHTVDQLFHNAGLALRRAKAEGGGTFRLFTAANDERTRLRQALTLDLGVALHRGEFSLAFQPFVSAGEGTVEGFEALLRWTHPVHGSVSPSEFVPIAEHAGLIGPIGAWAIDRACREAARWPGDLRVAVNLSPLQLRDPDLSRIVATALAASGLAPGRLELELTESRLIVDDEITRATMRRFREIGVSLAMDDFGAGCASLEILQRFRFDKVKIDRSFVARLPGSSEARALLRALLDMADALQIVSVVEGVETDAQLECARSEGCHLVQGFLYSQPVGSEDVLGVVAALDRASQARARPRGRFGLRRFGRVWSRPAGPPAPGNPVGGRPGGAGMPVPALSEASPPDPH